MAMQHPSTFVIALLILAAVTTAVGPSAANGNQRFNSIYQTLNTILAQASAKDVMGSYQRQTNTISLDRAGLDEPHLLSVGVPAGVTLQGYIEIDGHTRLPLSHTSEVLDIHAYLGASITRVTLTGSYSPASAAVAIAFNGPNTVVQQQVAGTGRINYQLNLVVP